MLPLPPAEGEGWGEGGDWMRFEGKVVLVTGAASGIGEATARRFAREGARVALNDAEAAGCERVAKELGAGALAVPG
ncbi:MAG TPA: SDR family NAD(P)-dependent oxidoreductase, partial [Methylomirabilota bacterium]|nr:SDR family NAD(P)-dependent oxidoreductase [Methylomirabilota bacterium]